MKRFSLLACFLLSAFLLSPEVFAQEADSTQAPPPRQQQGPSKVYYGGNVGFSFGNYFRLSVAPFVGYKVTPEASVGVKLGYEYVNDSRGVSSQSYSNYGASVFTRYLIIPQLYAHAEFAYYSYGFNARVGEDDREWVPFLLLGGGLRQPMGPRTSFIIEILFDVIQSDKSPYANWTPFISVGVGVGL